MAALQLTALNSDLGTWNVLLGEDNVSLTPLEDGEPLVIPRSETPGRFDLVRLWGDQAVLVVPRQKKLKKLQFRLEADQTKTIDQWLGPPTLVHLRQLLRKRYALGVPIGLFLILASLPMAADPAAGLDAVPASPITAVLGLGLMMMWLIVRFRPTPRLLLADSIWFCLLLVSTIADVVMGRSSALWLAFCLFLLLLIRSGLREYNRFRHLLSAEKVSETPPEVPI